MLASQYLAEYASGDIGSGDAYDEVDTLVVHDPDAGWRVVQALVTQASSDDELSFVAAGPLEDLLLCHGRRILPLLPARLAADEKMRAALGGVWTSSFPLSVQEEIERLLREYPSDVVLP